MPITRIDDGQHRYYDPDDPKAGNEYTSHDREKGKVGCMRQRQRSQRIDAKRKGEAPAAKIERHATSRIPRGFQYREQKPPSAITP